MTVDSYAFLPRAFRPLYEAVPHQDHEPVWAPFEVPLGEATIGLLSSAGIYLPASQPPFDVEREKREPTWGDPSLRVIPAGTGQQEIGATHLHIDTSDLLADADIALPTHRLAELAEAGQIGRAAPEAYSVMGFQEEGADVWRTETGPEIAARARDAGIDALVLAPA